MKIVQGDGVHGCGREWGMNPYKLAVRLGERSKASGG